MTTQLAIGYLAAGRGKTFGPVAAAGCSGAGVFIHTDAIAGRPAIPRAVIDWGIVASPDVSLPEVRLPVGAGDPATGVAGPASFRGIGRSPRRSRLSLEASLFGVVAVLLIGLAAAVTNVGAEPDVAVKVRTPVVEVRMTSDEMAGAPQVPSRGSSPTLAGAGRAPRVN